ncbi:type II CAAX endopeptidase family protein [uncultured Bacteroides sp.]|uniref:CPBP family intramembrane glutamic endopeptidase n=1 Tax=uncultured Bacteroides sp. TaxID=162156 RepID=UPI00262FE247|nr:type II CAAX endopeptidase family protein [uncultured Bacteroides sp.]
MKTAIKLVLIYFLMQILGTLTAGPIAVLYVYFTTGSLDPEAARRLMMAPALLLGMVYMTWYLWKKNYLADDGRMYSLTTPSCLTWSVVAGVTSIFLTNEAVSRLTFLPDLMKQTFDTLQSGWLGILCVAVLGPVLEELLFRGAITKVLLQKYTPAKAILLSGLVFGVFHINPAQVAGAFLTGILLAWLYWRTRSLVACILIHILNNSFAVYIGLNYPEVESMTELLGTPLVVAMAVVSLVLFLLSVKKLNAYQLFATNITDSKL